MINNDSASEILRASFYTESNPTVLAPKAPKMMLDQKYLLSAIGLLAGVDSELAFEIARKYLSPIGGRKDENRKQKMEFRKV